MYVFATTRVTIQFHSTLCYLYPFGQLREVHGRARRPGSRLPRRGDSPGPSLAHGGVPANRQRVRQNRAGPGHPFPVPPREVAYRTLSADHDVYKQYIPSAFEVALGMLKGYRKRVRRGRHTDVPYLRRLMLKAENQSYRLDRETGRLRIPIRAGQQAFLDLPLSDWHRSLLGDASWSLGSLTVTPDRVIVTVRKATPEPYLPMAAIALGTNEDSLARG